MRKGDVAAMRRECRRLASQITLARAGYRCQCGCGHGATDAMHVLAKGGQFASIRYVLDNLLAGNRKCHQRLGSATFTGESEMRELLIATRGRETWNRLLTLASMPEPDVQDILAGLRDEARRLGIR